ncbi:MAG TPA: FmdB family zinc ribbon protein [Gemmatimonadales bacterium]|nr:FmdB family zinc ribbon protein [Gemmatimonadales bacterium]
MPTYEYKCPAGHAFEKFYPTMNNQRRVKCPTCGRLATRLISGGAGLVFKGSGFYITDYKRAGDKPRSAEGEGKSTEPKPADAKPPAAPPADSAKKKKDSGDK